MDFLFNMAEDTEDQEAMEMSRMAIAYLSGHESVLVNTKDLLGILGRLSAVAAMLIIEDREKRMMGPIVTLAGVVDSIQKMTLEWAKQEASITGADNEE